MQLIFLTASFKFNWPEQVVRFFNTVKPVATASNQIFSFDCLIDPRVTESNVLQQIRIFFQKLIMYAILPIILLILVFGFWSLYRVIKRYKVNVGSRIMSTLVIVLFLVHPNIVQYMFFDFLCLNVDSEQRL